MWFIIIGIVVGILIAGAAGNSKKRTRQRTLTQQDQEIIENVAIIQPIIQDNHRH